jgi:hypothetical protein
VLLELLWQPNEDLLPTQLDTSVLSLPNEDPLLTQLDVSVFSLPTAIASFLLAALEHKLPTIVVTDTMSEPLLQLITFA